MGGILLDWALIYRDMGLCPVPLYRHDDPRDESGNKRPMLAGWQNLRMPDDAALERWFCDDRRNIGIVCGRVSGDLIVVDFDDMGAYFDWLAAADPPTTLTIDTGGGGVHCYYRLAGEAPGNHKLIGGDLRGQGGQVVAPPSMHLSGRRYNVRDESPIAIADLEALKLPLLIRPPLRERARQALAAGDTEPIVQTLAGAQAGDRNNTLLWCACRLFDQGLGLSQVESTLMLTALQIGLQRREIRLTIHNAQKQSRKARPPLPPHKILAARLERHGASRGAR